jgi:hypothetical protein
MSDIVYLPECARSLVQYHVLAARHVVQWWRDGEVLAHGPARDGDVLAHSPVQKWASDSEV